MAITSMDGIVVGLQSPNPILKTSFTGQAAGSYFTPFYTPGIPGAAAAPSPGLAGASLTSYAGQISFPSPISGQTVYLAGMDVGCSANVGCVLLCDRLWHNSGFTVTTTTAQTVTSSAWPARDANGSTNGTNVIIGMEVRTATTNAAPITNTTMSYTNSAGTAGQTGTITSFPANAVAGTFVPFNLAAGDVGVRSVQNVTLGTSYVTGSIGLVAYRIIAIAGIPTPNVTTKTDLVQLGFPTMYDNSVPFLLYGLTGTAGGTFNGSVVFAQG